MATQKVSLVTKEGEEMAPSAKCLKRNPRTWVCPQNSQRQLWWGELTPQWAR